MGTTAVSTDVRSAILTTAERYSGEIASLAPKGVQPAHYFASLRLYLGQNPKLLDCTPASIAQGLLRVAQTGLELGVSCDLLPFNKNCQFNPRYNGIIELALGAGVRAISADVVREGDAFEYEQGTNYFLKHVHGAKKGPITHAYAIAQIKVGASVFVVMDREEIDALRMKYSKSWAKEPQWANGRKVGERTIDLDEIPWYAKKTVVRRLSPYLPKNARLAAALMYAEEKDDEAADGTFEIVGPADDTQESPPASATEEFQDDRALVDA